MCDTNPRYKTEPIRTGQFGNSEGSKLSVLGLGKTVGHYAKDMQKAKRVETSRSQEKMLLCKQVRKLLCKVFKRFLNADLRQALTLALEQVSNDTDHNVFANDFTTFEQSGFLRNTCAVEERCDSYVIMTHGYLDVDDNKKIQKQLKKANATLTQELTECKSILAETSRTLGDLTVSG
ncbi:hypothetical protein Tco_0828748 [Tanacetum coccineum]